MARPLHGSRQPLDHPLEKEIKKMPHPPNYKENNEWQRMTIGVSSIILATVSVSARSTGQKHFLTLIYPLTDGNPESVIGAREK